MMSKHTFVKSSGNVFKDVGFDEIEAKSLKFRSHLMLMLVRHIQNKGMTQKEAAKCLGVTQPRVSNLMHGKIDLFSADMLLNMLEKAGFPIYKKIQVHTKDFFGKQARHHFEARYF